EIHDWIEQDMKKLEKDLAKFERVKNFIVKRQPFSVEAGEFTMTQKVKRKFVEAKYKDAIDAMYY
ncbi:MAG: long-chain fatty acid--CoA ligase, partial [Ignavibacteria bacterium]